MTDHELMPEDEARAQMSKFRAEMDQAREASAELASCIGRYYRELVDEGFEADQALTIVVAWQAALFAGRVDE